MDTTTDSSSYVGQAAVGYMINTALDEVNQQPVRILQNQLVTAFGPVVWPQPVESLHITLMDWLAPLVDYGRDKDELYQQLLPDYDAVLTQLLSGAGPIAVRFHTVKVSPSAIFVVGEDGGQFSAIRKEFISKITLLPNTKQPPEIIHFTIQRRTTNQ
jgi:hypothetical protein